MFALLASIASYVYYLPHKEKSFINWMRTTNQLYTGDEYQSRLGIFLTNSRLVKEHNSANNNKYTVSLNKYAALTHAEYKSLLDFKMDLTKRKPKEKQIQIHLIGVQKELLMESKINQIVDHVGHFYLFKKLNQQMQFHLENCKATQYKILLIVLQDVVDVLVVS